MNDPNLTVPETVETKTPVTGTSSGRRPRHKKKAHNLHRCAGVDELTDELGACDIDPVSLVYEFVRPAFGIGILATGSIAWRVATEVSDLDILVLLPSADAFKGKRRREVAGSIVKYLPTDRPNTAEVSLFLSGIEVDIFFVINPAVERHSDAKGGTDRSLVSADGHVAEVSFLNRLATGWILDGQDVVERWRTFYETDSLRMKWMATDFTMAAKNLEDMEAGIGLAPGHVAVIGVYVVTRLLRSLLAFNGCYCTSIKWMRMVNRLVSTVDPEMREALIRGRALAFPTLLEDAEEERAYFDSVLAYCGSVRNVLSRDEAMVDVLASIIHDLDIIL